MSFGANSRSVLHLFRQPESLRYKIPKYQRAYSWTEEEVGAFCEDLNLVIKNDTDNYFWGAVISIKDKDDENIQQVVDGQQRITTFTILISQLNNLCEDTLSKIRIETEMCKKNKYKYKDVETTLNEKKSDLSQCLKYKDYNKLTLSETDRVHFERIINNSNEVKLIEMCEMIIEEIENIDCIESIDSEIDKFKKVVKKNIHTNLIPKNLTYNDLKKIYVDKFNPKDNYNERKIEKELIVKYINDRLGDKSIRDYISDEILDEKDCQSITEFIKKIDESKNIESHKNLEKSWQIIEENIIKNILNINDISERCNKLISFIDKFINNTYVVSISADNEENAYMMFQVLNDRGRALGIIELLRPYTLQRLESEESYRDKVGYWWDEISKSEDCENYLKNYLSSYMYISDREKKLHNKYKEKFFKEKYSMSEIYNNVQKIYLMKNIYDKLVEGQWPYNKSKKDAWDKNRLYQIIKLLGYKKTIPLLIAIYEVGSEEDFIFAIDIIERTVFRYVTVCEKRPNKLTKIYSDTISDIRENGRFSKEVFKNNMKTLLESDGCEIRKFKENLEGKKLTYSNNNSKIIKYFISTIEYYYADYKSDKSKDILDKPSKSVILNDKVIEVEHIYPQSSKTKVKELELLKHNIGNLTLIEDKLNIEATNKDFVDKKQGYHKEKIELTKELINLSKWDQDEYNKRLELYRDIASKIFNII